MVRAEVGKNVNSTPVELPYRSSFEQLDSKMPYLTLSVFEVQFYLPFYQKSVLPRLDYFFGWTKI